MSEDVNSVIGTALNDAGVDGMVQIKLTGSEPFYSSGRQWSFKFLKWFITVNIR